MVMEPLAVNNAKESTLEILRRKFARSTLAKTARYARCRPQKINIGNKFAATMLHVERIASKLLTLNALKMLRKIVS